MFDAHPRLTRALKIGLLLMLSLAEGILLWTLLTRILPWLGVEISAWGLALLMGVWASWEQMAFRSRLRAMLQGPSRGPETIPGSAAITLTALTPEGRVRMGSEIWRARAEGAPLSAGVEVEVVERRQLLLIVRPRTVEPEGPGAETP